MLTLLFIRHAESVGNQQHRMQGHADYELSEQGWKQAECLAQRLTVEFCVPTCVYSSPIRRAKQTAQVILQHLPSQVSLAYDDRLKECDQGIFEGLTWLEASKLYPELCNKLETTMEWIPVPEAETPSEVRHRVHSWLKDIFTNHQGGHSLWIVAHQWLLCNLISALLGSDRTWQMPIDHTGIFEFSVDLDRWTHLDVETFSNSNLWQIHRFNDVQHLPSSPLSLSSQM
ncbi:MAG: histidine phosphatase family protein [Cyanobacteria bacterium P01_F01_bin.150]